MLNPRETVMLVAVHEGRRKLVGFHPKPGNYDVYLPPDVALVPGARLGFLCPACHGDLTLEEEPDFCLLELHRGEERRKLVFSRVSGERATFVFSEKGLEEHHGPEAFDHLEDMLGLRLFG